MWACVGECLVHILRHNGLYWEVNGRSVDSEVGGIRTLTSHHPCIANPVSYQWANHPNFPFYYSWVAKKQASFIRKIVNLMLTQALIFFNRIDYKLATLNWFKQKISQNNWFIQTPSCNKYNKTQRSWVRFCLVWIPY